MSVQLEWALDLELAGVPYHFATDALEAGGVQYASGLTGLELSKLADLDGSVEVQIKTLDDWPARFAVAQWLEAGGSATLWLAITEDGSTRRQHWLTGKVQRVVPAPPGSPIKVQIRAATAAQDIPTLRYRIDQYTAPSSYAFLPNHTGTWELWTPHIGQPYPLIIGRPGYDDASNYHQAVVPVPVIQYSDQNFTYDSGAVAVPEVLLYVVGDGRIGASYVTLRETGLTRKETSGSGAEDHVKSLDSDSEEMVLEVFYAQDNLGQSFRYVSLDLRTLSGGHDVEDYEGDPRAFVKFANIGGGVVWQGKMLQGASEIAEWIVTQYTDLRLDLGAHRTSARALDRYRFDTFLTERQNALDWLGELLEHVPAAWVVGDEGVYLAHIPLAADGTSSVLDVVEGPGGNAQRERVDVEDPSSVVNELTFRWGPTRAGDTFINARSITAEYQAAVAVPGGGVYRDTRATGSALCRVSQGTYGVRPDTLDLRMVWAQATAFQIASDEILRRALPARTFSYDLRPEFYWLRPGDVVSLTDAELSIDGVLCAVVDVVVGRTQIGISLRPLRGGTAYL